MWFICSQICGFCKQPWHPNTLEHLNFTPHTIQDVNPSVLIWIYFLGESVLLLIQAADGTASLYVISLLYNVKITICKKTKQTNRNMNGKKIRQWKAWRKLKLDKELKLLIGLLISCTLFDWFAINSGLWCIKDRGWRQPWSLWIPYTHLEGEGGRTSIRCCESGLGLTLILSSSFVGAMRQSVWNNTFSEREVMDDLSS